MRLSKRAKLYLGAGLLIVFGAVVFVVYPRGPSFGATFVAFDKDVAVIRIANHSHHEVIFSYFDQPFTCDEAFVSNLAAAPFEARGTREVRFRIVASNPPPSKLDLTLTPQSRRSTLEALVGRAIRLNFRKSF